MNVEDYKFDGIIESMIQNVDELSGKTGDYMKLVGDFARTGLDDVQSQEMANVATIMQNISELTPDESLNALTAAMISFGEATGGALRIADRLNEIDNNFAITTRDLGLALNKTASTAKTFGVSLDELLGYVTAIGTATRESGNIVGNSLKTIFSRITTNEQAVGALDAINISINDMEGNVRPVTEILDELAGVWDSLTEAEKQNTAVKVAGTNQLSRFNALMLNYDTGLKATETSIHSQNSAMNEQNKYAESLEARINRLQNAWYGFASTVGDKMLYDTIVVLTSAFKGLTGAGGSFVSGLGVMGPALGLVGAMIIAFNSNLRMSVINLGAQTIATYKASGATGIFSKSLAFVGATAKTATGALMGMRASLIAFAGIGAIFFAIGFAIEKVTNAISKNIQEQEKFDQYMQQNEEAITKNKDTVNQLISEYESLKTARENDPSWDADKEKEYLDVQTRLSELFPAIIDYVDSTGQAHIKSSEAIEEEIAVLEKLEEARKKALVAGAEDEFKDLLKDTTGAWYESISNMIYGSVEQRIEGLKDLIKEAQKVDPSNAKIDVWKYELLQLETQYAQTTQSVIGKINEVADASKKLALDPNVTKELDDFLRKLDFSQLDPAQLKTFSIAYAELQDQLSEAIETGNKGMYDNAIEGLNDLTKAMKLAEPEAKGFGVTYDDMVGKIEKGNNPVYVAGDAYEGLEGAIAGVKEATDDFKTVTESLTGISDKQISDTEDLIWKYDMLTVQLSKYKQEQLEDIMTKQNLTSEEAYLKEQIIERIRAMNALSGMYPSLLNLDRTAIALSKEQKEALDKEVKAHKVLQDAVKLSRDGKLSAEQDATVASARGTIARIQNMRAELDMLKKVAMAQAINAKILGAFNSMAGIGATVQQKMFENQISGYQAELDKLAGSLTTDIGKIKTFTDAINDSTKKTKDSTKAQKDKNKETEKSIYLTDQYKQSLEALNLAIAEQERIQSTLSTHDDKHIKSLKTQVELQKQKLQLMKGQASSMEKQIKAGNIQQTGNVSTKNASVTTSQSKDIGAFGAKISSGYGNRVLNGKKEFHRGVDLGAKAGESIMAPVSGKVIKAGDALSKSNGKKMDWTYGNMVVIQDDSGMKHILAHMNTVLTKFGDYVQAGTQVGTVGRTGNSTGNHLHYEQNTADGKLVNPMNTINAIRKNGFTMTSGGYATSNSAQDIDSAISDLNSLKESIYQEEGKLDELNMRVIQDFMDRFDFKKNQYDQFIENSDNRLKKLLDTSDDYRKELDAQANALNAKKKVNQDEINFLQDTIKNSGLTGKAVDDLKQKLHELGKANSEIDFAISDIEIEKAESLSRHIDSIIDGYDKKKKLIEDSLEYEKVLLEDIDIANLRYSQSLIKINNALRDKQTLNRQELTSLEKLIMSGKYYGEGLEKAQQTVKDLKLEIEQLQLEIQRGDYDVFVNVGIVYQDSMDKIGFEISRFESIRKMYEQGSGAYTDYTNKLIAEQKKLADQHLKLRDAWTEELKIRDLTEEDRRKAIKSIQEEHLAYLSATSAVKDYEKQLEEAGKAQKEDIANKFISALKEYYQELRDEQMKALDDMMKREQEAHDQRIKNLNDELNTFRRNVEERLRLIDRQEAERDYNMEIAELQEERNKIQEEYNVLLLDPTTKSQRKKLQEQLDKIDKDISEKRHKRDIELQKQGLNDQLELKEEEINGKIEIENEQFEATKAQIDKEKRYWEQHYNDLLNDEREFARIREDIMNGHFDKIVAEFSAHIDRMKLTLPDLQNTMDGTMKAVGDVIRLNVIDHLQEAIDKLNEFKTSSMDMGSFVDNFDSSQFFNENMGGEISKSKGNLTQGDLQVLLGKFLTDNVANMLSGNAKTQAHSAGNSLGSSGRASGSSIAKDASFDSAIRGLTPAELETLKQYFASNTGAGGGAYSKYISDFAGGGSGYAQTGKGGTNSYGLGTPMQYGDMQVLMAKYINENLLSQTQDSNIRKDLKSKADAMASQGRASGSQLASNVSFMALAGLMNESQKGQIKTFMSNQSGIISDSNLRNNFLRFVGSMDKGGMTQFRGGSSGGFDGKNGKLGLIHNGEIVQSPLEVSQLLQTARENRAMALQLAQATTGLNNPLTAQTMNQSFNNNDGLTVNFYGNIGTADKGIGKQLADDIFDELRRKKGVN